jgi:hypothetical protein
MRTKAVVVLALSALVLTLIGSAYVAVRVVSARNNSVIPGFPAFKNNGYTLSAKWFNQYWSSTATLLGVDHCLRDKDGICVLVKDGKTYNHPVVQANDGLYSLSLYAQSGDSTYLTRAEAEANRLVSYKTVYENAWWYPYEFNFVEYGQSQYTLKAPWYSAMAQGEILDLFTQLYKLTGAATWKADAASTFTSFLDPWTTSKGTKPWVDRVDSSGYLWLEEYPTNLNDDVINGADFAIWGVVDYANEFHSSKAAYLASGALTTMLHAIGLVHHHNWIVGYSVSHPTDEIPAYHVIVTEQFLTFAEITGASVFARIALELAADFPLYPVVTGTITLAAGPHLMAHVNASTLTATSVSTVQVPANTTAPVMARVKIAHQSGYWYVVGTGFWEVIAGSSANALSTPVSIDQVGIVPPKSGASTSTPYAGLYIQEQAGTAYLPGICNQLDFTPSLQTTFEPGTYTLYTSNGEVLTEKSTLIVTSPELLPASYRETIGGITVWAISSGIYQGDYIQGPPPIVF